MNNEPQDKMKHNAKDKMHCIKLADRVGRSLCVHCGEKPMLPNSGLCSYCRQLPRYQELLTE